MGLIIKPNNIDFSIKSEPLTDSKLTELRQFIRENKLKAGNNFLKIIRINSLPLKSLYGVLKSDLSSEEIIEALRASRVFNRNIESL